MKKFSTVLLALLLVLSLITGCSDTADTSDGSSTTSSATASTEVTTTTSEEKTQSTSQSADKVGQTSANTNVTSKSSTVAATTSVNFDELFGTTTTKATVASIRTAKETAKLINNRLTTKSVKLNAERAIVHYPTASDTYKFSHGVTLTINNDKIFVTWQNSYNIESDCGQRAAYAYASLSDFQNWSDVLTLPYGETEMGVNSELVKGGELIAYNGKLYARVQASEWETKNMQGPNTRPPTDEQRINITHKWSVTTDGVNWKDAVNCPFYYTNQIQYKSNLFFRVYNDGSLLFCKDPGKDTESGYHKAEFTAVKEKNGIPSLIWPAMYQTADGTIRILWRTQAGFMMMSESYDYGYTFTEPYKTSFTNGRAKFNCGNLPDGRAFCIYNPEADRNPLVIAIAEDKEGLNFNKEYVIRDENTSIQFPAQFKAEGYAYPDYKIHGEYLYVAYSVNKEGVEVVRIKISDLK